MSLINDALKRAKQVQQEQPARTEPGPQLRPIEARPVERNGLALALPAVALVILGLGCFVVWNSLAHKSETPGQTANISPIEQISASAPTASPTTLSRSTASAATAPAAQQVGNSTTQTLASSQVETASAGIPSGAQAAAETAAPKPAVPRLQGIFYHPTRPTAMINGKSVTIGDKVGELRVAAIDQESITLAGGGQTNVLTLP